jgi:histone deacetylase complex regulatory component SIN3
MPVPRVCGRIGTKEVVSRVKKILNGMPPALTEGFNRFLPPDHQIRTEKFSIALDLVQKIRERFSPEHPEVPDAPSLPAGLAALSRARRTPILTAAPRAPPLPQVLEEFLSALHAFQSDRTSLAEARSQVTAAFHGHDDLIHDFDTFLPLRAEQEMAQGLSKRRRPCTSIAAARALRPGRRRCAAEGNTLPAGRAACAGSRAGAGARTGLDESRKRRREQLAAEAARRWRTRLPSIADVKLRRAIATEGAAPPGDAPDSASLAASEPARRAGRKQSAPRRAPAAGDEAAGGAAAHAPLFLVRHPPRSAQPPPGPQRGSAGHCRA